MMRISTHAQTWNEKLVVIVPGIGDHRDNNLMFSLKKQSICMYPCPCGFHGSNTKPCTCSHQTVTRYQKRISGPMLDRIDIHIEVPRVDFEKLSDKRRGESSDDIRARVENARQKQRERFSELNNGVMTNTDMRVAEVRQFCELDDAGQQLVKAAMAQLQLSARAYHRILKLARTIADLAGAVNDN